MSARAPGSSVCSVKQKHSILLKYWPAASGVTLNVAVPVIALSSQCSWLRSEPVRCHQSAISTLRCTGLNSQPMSRARFASKRTVSVTFEHRIRCSCSARCVVPPYPVTLTEQSDRAERRHTTFRPCRQTRAAIASATERLRRSGLARVFLRLSAFFGLLLRFMSCRCCSA